MIAGYSGTPLYKKLGIQPGFKLLLINRPTDYFLLLEKNISDQICKRNQIPDLIHLFVKNKKEFESEMKKISSVIRKNPDIIIWVSWYKKSSGLITDITEDNIRYYALKNGLVDVKVCAVNSIWSGLKLVVPLNQRKITKT